MNAELRLRRATRVYRLLFSLVAGALLLCGHPARSRAMSTARVTGTPGNSEPGPLQPISSGPVVPAGNTGATPVASPTPVVTQPATATTHTHHLGQIAQTLGSLGRSAYTEIQVKWLGTEEPACNFFVATAMCEDGYCANGDIPHVLAANYGTYLEQRGWQQIDLNTLESMFLTNQDFDVIMQSDGTASSQHGHVLIPLGLTSTGGIRVAQGELETVTNELYTWTSSSLMTYDGGMQIWINQN